MADFLVELCKLSNSFCYSTFFNDRSTDIFHYTSPSGFKSIIENQRLRFSDRNYLNDSSEGSFVLELCLDEIDNITPDDEQFKNCFKKVCEDRSQKPKRDYFYVFQCSFSVDKDSLCLWNYYTKGDGVRGYNLHFKSKELQKKIRMKSKMKDGRTPKIVTSKVIYKRRAQIEIVKEVIRAFYDFSVEHNKHDLQFTTEFLVDKLMILGAFFKKQCFKPENEYRFVIDLCLDENGQYMAIEDKQEFVEKDGIFIPYVDLEFETDALKSISMSPTLDFERTKESIFRLTQSNFKQFKNRDLIKKSEIPLRY